jgi:hypothetical protein
MLQGPALNNMVCDIFNWQLAKHIHMPRSSAKLAHPVAPWLRPEPASGDSNGVPAKAHPLPITHDGNPYMSSDNRCIATVVCL